jgi:two-component system phosphate regulon response regulator OmpR
MKDLPLRRVSQVAEFGEFTLDFQKMELSHGNEPVSLTLQEFKVLKFFVARPEIVMTRQTLIRSVWPKRERSSYRTVDNVIARLRRKIERDPDSPAFIQTVYGVGYKFVPHGKERLLNRNLAQ